LRYAASDGFGDVFRPLKTFIPEKSNVPALLLYELAQVYQ
jgi:hypothetical protein